jgi:hypothetical protein
MRKIYSVVLLLAGFSCTSPSNTANTTGTSSNFDWLLGDWHRSNEQPGKETFEHWTKVSDVEYVGLGYTMQLNDTVWKEDIKLIYTEEGWQYKVIVTESSEPTIFLLTSMDQQSFRCENAQNDFPKVIEYARSGNNINAVISGGDMEIPYEFEPMEVSL